MSPPILLLDMDGPLADFDGHFYAEALRRGFDFDIPDLTHQKHRFLTDHMPVKNERKFMRQVVESNPTWFLDLPITEGATEGVAALKELDDAGVLEVWVCTKPLEANVWCRDAKASWLSRYFPWLLDRLIIAPDKSVVYGNILLDDAPKPSWFDKHDGRAQWEPVLFTSPFHGDESVWAGLPTWSWAQPFDELLCHDSRMWISHKRYTRSVA